MIKDNIVYVIRFIVINITPRIKVWKRAFQNYKKSEDELENILNEDKLLTIEGQQANNVNTYWKFVLYTEEIKLITLSLFIFGLFITQSYDLIKILLIILAILIILFWNTEDIRWNSP